MSDQDNFVQSSNLSLLNTNFIKNRDDKIRYTFPYKIGNKEFLLRKYLTEEELSIISAIDSVNTEDSKEIQKLNILVLSVVEKCTKIRDKNTIRDVNMSELTQKEVKLLIMKLRSISYNEIVKLRLTCPHCGNQNKSDFEVNLIKYTEDENNTKPNEKFSIDIVDPVFNSPENKAQIIFNGFPYLGFFKLQDMEEPSEILYYMFYECIHSIRTEQKSYSKSELDINIVKEMLQNMEVNNFQKINLLLNEIIKDDIDLIINGIKCDNEDCKKDFFINLNTDLSQFFFL